MMLNVSLSSGNIFSLLLVRWQRHCSVLSINLCKSSYTFQIFTASNDESIRQLLLSVRWEMFSFSQLLRCVSWTFCYFLKTKIQFPKYLLKTCSVIITLLCSHYTLQEVENTMFRTCNSSLSNPMWCFWSSFRKKEVILPNCAVLEPLCSCLLPQSSCIWPVETGLW